MAERTFLPCLHVRGTYYDVGFSTGKAFKSMIEEYVQQSSYLKDELLPAYNTSRGKHIYQDTLNLMLKKFPHYVRELQGIADGSQVPFHQLMLLHVDTMILTDTVGSDHSGNGCSTIMCNQKDVVLGHTEDALPPALHHCYVVHAEIIESEGGPVRHEKFSSLCYAGHLPGFCMSVNQHGLVFSINVIEALRVHPDKTPRHFLTRALLSARNLAEAQIILGDVGTGSAHGFCVNMAFTHQEGPVLFHSAEVGPAENGTSQLSILTVSPGESHLHCNKFLRLNVSEDPGILTVLSSKSRHRLMDRMGSPQTVEDVVDFLSNQEDPDYPVYRCGTAKDYVKTIATGIFDFTRKEWRLYVDKPNGSSPIAVFPMEF